ncbi:MAG: helix-turn-helix domain-containing protein [Bacteroides sp.]|jgi:ligand-binding sensor domain-containing protein/AraC-like DNA-binding protein|nr:helix-turn-helix domain-containing protein [Bacteroides sp.]MCI1683552.1 helix-turn-helix domain-containing protein [Bacteroides sp.]
MQYPIRNILIFLFTVFLLSSTLSGNPHTYTFRGLSITEGLSDLVVNALYKDSEGFVWIGTGNSLERFDGIRLKHYKIPGTNEKLKRVNVILQTDDRKIWMGNGMGLWRINPQKEELEQIETNLIRNGVRSLLKDDKGNLYIGSESGLFIYNKEKTEHYLIDSNVLSTANNIAGLSLDNEGKLWIATAKGLYSMSPSDKKITFHQTTGGASNSYSNITLIDQNIYLGTMEQGLIRYEKTTGKFSHYIDVGCNVISSISTDGKDMLYVGTDGNGVHFISTRQNKVMRSFRHEQGKDESLRSNSVYSLLVDRDGLLWVGFYQLGLDYSLYQRDLFSTYSYPPYFNSKDMPVRTIAINNNERLIGSRDGLFYINETTRCFKSFKSPELRSSMIMCSLYYHGQYYVGTYGGGMYVFDPQALSIRDFEPNIAQPFLKGQIFCIKEDNEGNLWIGTSMGLYRYKDGKEINHFTTANSRLPEGNVYEIFFDSTHKGWICTENGLCIWDPSSQSLKTEIFPPNFTIDKEKIRVIFEDSEHNLYFLPDKGNMCISTLSMGNFHRLGSNNPMAGKDGMFIAEDKEKWLWIGTTNGLYRYDKENTFIPYNFIDGIPSAIFTFCPPVKDNKNILWMGNSKGLIFFDLNKKNKIQQCNYPLAITNIYINGKPTIHPRVTKNGHYNIKLNSSQDNLTLYFSSFNYTEPAYMTYEYKLEGEDKEWQVLTGQSEITYYDLSSGHYLFKLRKIGDPTSEIQAAIHIAYPWLKWSLSTLALIVVFSGGYFLYYRSRKAKAITVQDTSMLQLPEEDAIHTKGEKYKTNKISNEDCQKLSDHLSDIMHKEKPYINPDLKLADLATLLGTSPHSMSFLFNQYLNKNYYDYINDYRIEEFKHLIDKDEYSKYTLSALAELCGFSSRASFFRYFKKATGITPNEYIRSIGKTNE